ncbi:MAG: uracil-DNA glycosylase [Magnetococcales bacterium]|nr:uracil-DNA glycosylase [Magnetococcales bacterium]
MAKHSSTLKNQSEPANQPMNLSDLTATLEYWQTAGILSLSSDRLQFPPESRPSPIPGISSGNNDSPATQRQQPTHTPKPSPPPPPAPPPQPVTLTTAPLPPDLRREKLDTLARSLTDCTRCELARMRKHMVFGVGNIGAEVVFVGEGPGAEEDLRAEPFVGDAGKLLNKMIHAIPLQRHEVYIANVVKCRPPDNRNPLPPEIDQCQPFLFEQLETIRPKVIFALGRFAILCLTHHSGPIEKIRGKTPLWRGIPVIPSYHPAFYLRSPSRKKAAWEDLIRLKKILLF